MQLLVWGSVLVVICVPWPLAMKLIWGDRFFQILGEELAERKIAGFSALSPLSALGGALGLVFPWTLIVLGAVFQHFRKAVAERHSGVTWLIAWFLLSVVPFFFMKSFERYMLAVLPAQAVLCAEWLQAEETSWPRKLWGLSLGLIGLAVCVWCGFGFWFRLGIAGPLAGIALGAALVGLGFSGRDFRAGALAAAAAFTLCFGVVYPHLGIGSMPLDLAEKVRGHQVIQFRSGQPSLLSMRLGQSVPRVTPQKLGGVVGPHGKIVFVETTQQSLFDQSVKDAGLEIREIGRFPTFYSRKAWLRFARPDATWADWQAAFRARSLEALKSEVRYYLVRVPTPS
jgi:hypothetical protein